MIEIPEEVLNVFLRMQREGIIKKFALGGGMAAKFWCNPPATRDMDFFVILNSEGSGDIGLMQEVYNYMITYEEAKWKGQHLLYLGYLLDILPAHGLIKEAVECASNYLITPNYLAAISYMTARKKDGERIKALNESGLITGEFRELVFKYKR